MSMHTRKPYKLDYKSYLTWMREFVKWLTARAGDADYPSHIIPSIASFEDLIDQFEAILGPYDNLIQLAHAKNKLYTAAFENLYDKLKQIKWALPTIADEPDILALFSLAGELPDDRDDMFITAQNCLNYWATVAADPMFAPMVPDFDALQTLFDDFVDAREVYFNTDNERETKQNELIAVKEQIDEIERDCFQWYRSRHPNGQDEWWTATEWGTTGGGSGGGGEEPQPGSWEDEPTNFVVREGVAGSALLTADIHRDADGCAVFMAETDLGVAEPPMRPGEPVAPLITPLDPGKFSYNLNIPANRRVWFWICHVKNGAWGAMAGPKWIEVIK